LKPHLNLYTIGYEKRNIDEYIDLLLQNGVSILIDVRETAWSYKNDFCKTNFSSALSKKGITYLHLPQAGNPKKLRKSSTSIQMCLEKYRTYLMETNSGISDLQDILIAAGMAGDSVCLTCYERNHENCHRSIIVDFVSHNLSFNRINHL